MSTPHLTMKFPSTGGDVITIHVDQKTTRECYVASLRLEPTRPEIEKHRKKARGKEERQSVNVTDMDLRTNHARVEPGENVVQIELGDKEHCTKLGISLGEKEAEMI